MSETKLIGICHQSKVAFDVPEEVTDVMNAVRAIDCDRGQDTLAPTYESVDWLDDHYAGYFIFRVPHDIDTDDIDEKMVSELSVTSVVGIIHCTYQN